MRDGSIFYDQFDVSNGDCCHDIIMDKRRIINAADFGLSRRKRVSFWRTYYGFGIILADLYIKRSSPKGLLFHFMKLKKRKEARDSNKEGASAGCGRKQSGGLFSPTGQRAKRGDRRGQRRTKSLALRHKTPIYSSRN